MLPFRRTTWILSCTHNRGVESAHVVDGRAPQHRISTAGGLGKPRLRLDIQGSVSEGPAEVGSVAVRVATHSAPYGRRSGFWGASIGAVIMRFIPVVTPGSCCTFLHDRRY